MLKFLSKIAFVGKNPTIIISILLSKFPKFHFLKETEYITIYTWFWQKIVGFNKKAYWPMHISSRVIEPLNVYCGVEVCPGFSPGCYIQAINGIYFGDYVQIGPNVGVISANHDIYDNTRHLNKTPIIIGDYSWLGMNSVILPGVVLGEFTIVAAGAIVTKSFPDGFCVLTGNPAQKIRDLEVSQCKRTKRKYEYNGYIKNQKFGNYIEKNLNFKLTPFRLNK